MSLASAQSPLYAALCSPGDKFRQWAIKGNNLSSLLCLADGMSTIAQESCAQVRSQLMVPAAPPLESRTQ